MTARMQIKNGESQIKGLTRDQHRKLWHELSYEVDTGRADYKTKIVDGNRERVRIPKMARTSLLNKHGRFPSGLVNHVADFLTHTKVVFEIDDQRIAPPLQSHADDFQIAQETFVPLAWQGEAALAAVSAERGIVAAPTGTGKSIAACMIMYGFGVKTLIVVPSLTLKEQLTSTINWMFGSRTAGPLVKRKASYTVTVENIDALRTTDDLSGVDLLLLDEYHHSAAETYREHSVGLWKDIYYRIGLTATPFRSRNEEAMRMAAIVSDVVYQLPYSKAISDGLISPMEVYFVDADRPSSRTEAYSDYHKAYRGLVVDNEAAISQIANISRTLYQGSKSALVLCRQIEHGNAIKEKLWDEYAIDVPFAEGESDLKSHDIENFCKQVEPLLIGTVGVLGEGVDTKPAEYVVIAGAGKAKVQLMQNLGRGFRTFPGKKMCRIIIIRYTGNRWLEKHFEDTVEHIKTEYGLDVKPLPQDWITWIGDDLL